MRGARHREGADEGLLSTFDKYDDMGQVRFRYPARFTYRAHGERTNGLTGSYVDTSTSVGVGVDDAWSTPTDVIGTPSCVAVGR